MTTKQLSTPVCLYQETRLNLGHSPPASIVDVLLSPQSSYGFSSRASAKRRRLDRSDVVYDEQYFSQHHLSPESSIFFRRLADDPAKQQYPRSILWRVLENRKVLELQGVDLFQQPPQEEPLLTLRFEFTHAIKPGAVVFAEYDEQAAKPDTVVVFVVTEKNELYTLSLRRAAFEQTSYLQDSSDWFKSCVPGSLSSHSLHRLYARSPDEVWMTLSNGSLARLEKQPSDNGSNWREAFYTEGGWTASFRGLIPWGGHSSVRYNGIDLSASTATSLAFAPTGTHVWSVSLDHILRAWDIETGQVTAKLDLLYDQERDLTRPSSVMLEPSQSQLIHVDQSMDHSNAYRMLTFSPKTNSFKFWTVSNATSSDGTKPSHPDIDLSIPLGDSQDSSVWSLDAFNLIRSSGAGKGKRAWTLWTFARSGSRYQILNLDIDMAKPESEVAKQWQSGWVTVAHGHNTPDAWEQTLSFPTSSAGDYPTGLASDEWPKFLFQPGRVAVSTFETALVVYRRRQDSRRHRISSTSILEKRPIDERITEAVELTALSKSVVADDQWSEVREKGLSQEWEIFYSLVKDLHKRCQLPISLAVDQECEVPWLVMANQIAPIRTYAQPELLRYNAPLHSSLADGARSDNVLLLSALKSDRSDQMQQLLFVFDQLASSVPLSTLKRFHNELRADCFNTLRISAETRMQAIHGKVDFASTISDEDWQVVSQAIEAMGGFEIFTNSQGSVMRELTDILTESVEGVSGKTKRQMTRYGSRFLIRGAQETIQFGMNVLLKIILLVVFIGCELEELPEELSPDVVYRQLSDLYRAFEVRSWLANTIPTLPSGSAGDSSKRLTLSDEMTLMESILLGDWATMKSPKLDMISWLTYSCRAWTFGVDLDLQYESVTAHVMGIMLREQALVEASNFGYFLPNTPWTSYLKGRLTIALGEVDLAATWFESAAESLTKDSSIVETFDTANLLDLEERNSFGEGRAPYYQHVARIFEKTGAQSYNVEFLQKAIKIHDADRVANSKLRSDLLARLFSSLLQTLRFKEALATLQVYSDLALRKADLRNLIQALLSAKQAPMLLSASFEGDPDLAEEIDEYLGSMVSSSSGLNGSGALSSASSSTASPHKILYAWRISRSDYRGAAACLWDRLQVVEAEGSLSAHADEEKAELFLGAMNALSLLKEDDAWILSRPAPAVKQVLDVSRPSSAKSTKRRIVTLAQIRAAWQDELDRLADIEAGRFPLSESMRVEAPRAVGFV